VIVVPPEILRDALVLDSRPVTLVDAAVGPLDQRRRPGRADFRRTFRVVDLAQMHRPTDAERARVLILAVVRARDRQVEAAVAREREVRERQDQVSRQGIDVLPRKLIKRVAILAEALGVVFVIVLSLNVRRKSEYDETSY